MGMPVHRRVTPPEISFLQSQSVHKFLSFHKTMETLLEVVVFDIYLVRSKSFEHSETYSSYEEENCDGHHDQGKNCLRIIYT